MHIRKYYSKFCNTYIFKLFLLKIKTLKANLHALDFFLIMSNDIECNNKQ